MLRVRARESHFVENLVVYGMAMWGTIAPERIGDRSARLTAFAVAAILAVHVPLGILVLHSPTFAQLHATLALGFGIWAALRWRAEAVACAAAYVVGGEVLWRMANAPIPWEFGKYAITAILGIALLRLGRRLVWRPLPLLYFCALLPSALVVLADRSVTTDMSLMLMRFNLSGPLSLFVSVWFLSQCKFRTADFHRLAVALIAPTIAIASITLFTTYTATAISFTGESNYTTSGGFGPNQVSVALGLGALMALLYTLDRNTRPTIKLIATASMVLLAAQSAMTFSRGGLYSAVGAAGIGMMFFIYDRRVRRTFFLVVALLVIPAGAILLPRLDSFTGGALAARFSNTDPTNRWEIMLDDLKIWREHPLLGVGPGGANDLRDQEQTAGHTEYTRLLAEHGTLGLIALVMLCGMAAAVLLRRDEPMSRGISVTLLAWSMLSMLHADMRIAAMGFIFGLAHAHFQPPPFNSPPDPSKIGILQPTSPTF